MKSLRKRATYFSLNQFEVEVEVEVERFLECARNYSGSAGGLPC